MDVKATLRIANSNKKEGKKKCQNPQKGWNVKTDENGWDHRYLYSSRYLWLRPVSKLLLVVYGIVIRCKGVWRANQELFVIHNDAAH